MLQLLLQLLTFFCRFITTLISLINFMTMDFDYLNYVTSTELKKVIDNDESVWDPSTDPDFELRTFLGAP